MTLAIPTTRRRFIASVAIASTSVAVASAPQDLPRRLAAGKFGTPVEPKPLRFDPSKMNDLSAELIESHWRNNYGGSVRALNSVKIQLIEALASPQTPAFVYNGLKREHLLRNGSVVLHELYFDNLGGNGQVSAAMRSAIETDFGEFAIWENEFRRIAAGLGGGSGWVVLAYNHHLDQLENFWMADHMHHPAGSSPILVLDMYEHAYAIDYGASADRYIDAFFGNLDWAMVLQRHQRAVA